MMLAECAGGFKSKVTIRREDGGDERGAAEARRGPPAWAAVLDAQWPGSAGRAAARTLPGALRAAADVAVVGRAGVGLQCER